MNRTFFLVSMAACLAHAQGPPPGDAGQSRPLSPLFLILDANQNGVIDPDEIANASATLKKLDRNGDGRLSPDEYRPARPDGSAPPSAEPKPPSPPGTKGALQGPPRPLIDLALDANGDEVIDADEIANAPALLKKLDANGDGRLSRDECMPRRAASGEQAGRTR